MPSSQSSSPWPSSGYSTEPIYDYSREETYLNQSSSAPYTPPFAFNDTASQLVQQQIETAISPVGYTIGASPAPWHMQVDPLSSYTVRTLAVSTNGNPYSPTRGSWNSRQNLERSMDPSYRRWQEGQRSGFSQLATPSSSNSGSVLPMRSSTDGYDRAERRFKCQYCSKAFTAKHNLQSHIDLKHLNKDKPIHCEFCGKAFTGTRALVRHMENRNACPSSTRAK
ncbi:hypothetical protein GYMLUDRAFT_256554 [Collybiopsis luxurians FD-317 M1]|nr:hypothetical protein GYMLUDRAFT_256554 [Collybiopsis luxurians FD-317 M1]